MNPHECPCVQAEKPVEPCGPDCWHFAAWNKVRPVACKNCGDAPKVRRGQVKQIRRDDLGATEALLTKLGFTRLRGEFSQYGRPIPAGRYTRHDSPELGSIMLCIEPGKGGEPGAWIEFHFDGGGKFIGHAIGRK